VGETFNPMLATYAISIITAELRGSLNYRNANVVLKVTAGTGLVMCFGASANNKSNAPASPLAVQTE